MDGTYRKGERGQGMRLIDGDYLYNKLVANKCPYDLVLQMVKDEPTVCDIEQIRAEIQAYGDKLELCKASPSLEYILQIIDKYTKGE